MWYIETSNISRDCICLHGVKVSRYRQDNLTGYLVINTAVLLILLTIYTVLLNRAIDLGVTRKSHMTNTVSQDNVCACVCVFFPSILDIKFVGRTSRGHTGGRSHRIFNPPSFCGACLDFCREKDSAIPFPRRP